MTRSRDGWDGNLSVTGHSYIPNTSRELRTTLRNHSQGNSIFKTITSQGIQLHSTISDSGIITHQTDTQRDYLLDIVTISILYTTGGITKYTTTKQSGNWKRWCKFQTHTGITRQFLDGIPQWEKTILVSSFTSSVQRNQFDATSKPKLLNGTVKSAISDISTSFRTYLRGDPNLDVSGQRYLSLQWNIRGCKSV